MNIPGRVCQSEVGVSELRSKESLHAGKETNCPDHVIHQPLRVTLAGLHCLNQRLVVNFKQDLGAVNHDTENRVRHLVSDLDVVPLLVLCEGERRLVDPHEILVANLLRESKETLKHRVVLRFADDSESLVSHGCHTILEERRIVCEGVCRAARALLYDPRRNEELLGTFIRRVCRFVECVPHWNVSVAVLTDQRIVVPPADQAGTQCHPEVFTSDRNQSLACVLKFGKALGVFGKSVLNLSDDRVGLGI